MTQSTVVAIIGNGPSALILSYILNGHIPYYDPLPYGPHPDGILHKLLTKYVNRPEVNNSLSLLNAASDNQIIEYIKCSYESFFSSTTLPINLLMDSLCASDESSFMCLNAKQTRINWVSDSKAKLPHIVLGNSSRPGGQWESYELDSKDELSLSYAEMLSLPQYSFSEYYNDTYNEMPRDFYRPPRYQVADYYAAYPHKVGIHESIKSNVIVTCVDRATHTDSFVISMRHTGDRETTWQEVITCQKVVLATGIFESPLTIASDMNNIHKKKTFQELAFALTTVSSSSLSSSSTSTSSSLITNENSSYIKTINTNNHHLTFTIIPPLSTPPCEACEEDASASGRPQNETTLIIGTGISAAEAINKCPPGSSIIHIYKWLDSRGSPCVFRRFPKELYPDYVKVFSMMKQRKFGNFYEGLPNAQVIDISPDGVVEIKLEDENTVIYRTVKCVKVCTGRAGSLAYLSDTILGDAAIPTATTPITKKTLRETIIDHKCQTSLCLSQKVYAIGSLCGDTVVRFMLGSCVSVAGELLTPNR